jgi:hypothetical protein
MMLASSCARTEPGATVADGPGVRVVRAQVRGIT